MSEAAGGDNDLPVAVITAYGSAENAVAALKAGAFDYVSKPVGLEQLRALVKSALSLPDQAEPPALDLPLLGASAPRLTLWSSLRCARLKLWDEEREKLIGYRELRRRAVEVGEAERAA